MILNLNNCSQKELKPHQNRMTKNIWKVEENNGIIFYTQGENGTA
jgi:hypothetical protein